MPTTVTIPTAAGDTSTATVTLHTTDDSRDNRPYRKSNLGTEIEITIDASDDPRAPGGYLRVEPYAASVTIEDDEFAPVVGVTANSASVTEGSNIVFTLTAEPPPAAPLSVGLSWRIDPDNLEYPQHPYTNENPPPTTVTIPTGPGDSSSATVTLSTTDDNRKNNPHGTSTEIAVTINASHDPLAAGGYFRYPSTASVTIEDDDTG